ncbi:MAG: secretin N-terminal domain-containing protein [Actinomycetota bacterium]
MAVLSPLGRIQAMPRENRLIVVDLPENIEMLRRVLVRIDRPRPQVRITALIYDLSLEDVERLDVVERDRRLLATRQRSGRTFAQTVDLVASDDPGLGGVGLTNGHLESDVDQVRLVVAVRDGDAGTEDTDFVLRVVRGDAGGLERPVLGGCRGRRRTSTRNQSHGCEQSDDGQLGGTCLHWISPSFARSTVGPVGNGARCCAPCTM